jgi:hypothetical protein
MTDVSKLQQKLDVLIHKSFDSFVSYKKKAKNYDDSKKLLERDLETDYVEKLLKTVQSQLENLKSVDFSNSKMPLYKKFKEQERMYKEFLKHKEENNTDQWWINLETAFLKDKEKFRENKIKLLEKINKILMSLKKKMGANYREFIKELYLIKLTDDTNTYTYTVKTIMKHLKSGPISANAAKKSKKLNELQSRKNIYNRKTQMEIEIEMIKLNNLLEKEKKYKNLLREKIKKIIDNKDDKKIKNKLFKIVTINNTNKNGKAIKEIISYVVPEEFDKFIGSKNQNIEYQNEIDKYNEKLIKLIDEKKFITNKIAKLKGINLNELNSSANNRPPNNSNAVDNGFQVPKGQLNGRKKELKKLPSKLNNLREEIEILIEKYKKYNNQIEKNIEIFKVGILGLYKVGRKFKGLAKESIFKEKNDDVIWLTYAIDLVFNLKNQDKDIQEWINKTKKSNEDLGNWAGEVLEEIEEKELLFQQLSSQIKNSEK